MGETIKIRYKRSRIRNGLIFSGIMIGAWLLMTILYPETRINFVVLAFAVLYLAMVLRDHHKQYLTVRDGMLKKNTLPPKKVRLQEVESVRKFAGDYTLKYGDKKLVIHTDWIDGESLKKMNEILMQYDILEE